MIEVGAISHPRGAVNSRQTSFRSDRQNVGEYSPSLVDLRLDLAGDRPNRRGEELWSGWDQTGKNRS